MRIGITYNLKSDVSISSSEPFAEDIAEEFDLPETIQAIQDVLSGEGHDVYRLGGNLDVLEQIKRFRIEFVFNIAEGFHGRNREAHIPALLELLKIPYSGSDPLGLAITLDKSLAKRVAISLGISTPKFWILDQKNNFEEISNQFPLFVKPLWQGSSRGIRRSSRVENRSQLGQEINRLFEHYSGEPVLVEEYISGREFTVGVIGNKPPEILGVMELSFREGMNRDFCYSLEVKRNWKSEVEYHVPVQLDRTIEKGIEDAASSLFKVLRLRDFARFDFRVNSKGQFYFLEANPLAGLSPESGDIIILGKKKGLGYSEIILKILHAAFGRYPELTQSKVTGGTNG